jgi:iron complex outermembrane receptor protein
MVKRVFLASSVALVLWSGTLQAQAADSATAPAPAAQSQTSAEPEAAGLQEIIVTAQRRGEDLQRVPLSVIAVQPETLRTLQIETVADLPQLAPGLTVVRSGGIVPYIRSVGTLTVGFTGEGAVAIYLDGVYQPNASSALFSFNDIERIEVLKGPQGTLYGRNSTGGLINVVTRSPEGPAQVEGSIGYGNYQTIDARLYASTPLTDNLWFNFSVTDSHQGEGYAINTVTGDRILTNEQTGLQSKLLWEPGANTKIELRGFYNYTRNDDGIAFFILPGTVTTDGTPSPGKFLSATRRDPYSKLNQHNVSLKVDQDLEFATFTSLTSYSHAEQPLRFTQSGSPGAPVLGRSAVELNLFGRSSTFSQEFQLTSAKSDSPFEWVVGAFYLNDDTFLRQETYGTCIGSTCAPAPIPTRLYSWPTTRSYSAYGEGTYEVTPTTRVTLGARYTYDEKALSGYTEPLPGLPNSPATLAPTVVIHPGDPYPGNPTGIPTESTYSKVTERAVLAQDLSDHISTYLSYNRGFKSGTYNPIAFNNAPVRPEVLDAFAAGIKSELFDRLLRLNVEGFHYNYKDLQLRSTAPPAPVGGALLLNAAKAKIDGVDVDFTLAPSRNFAINGSVEYLDAHYVSFTGGTCVTPRTIGGAILGGSTAKPCDLSGARVPQAPELSFTLGASYGFDTGIGRIIAAINDAFKGRYNLTGDGYIQNAPYHLLNASLNWESLHGHYNAQLYGRNLTNSYYYVGAGEAVANNDLYLAGAPRTYGVTLGFKF